MNYPTKKEVLEAATTSKEARGALEVLFPEVFASKLQGGQIYEWGSSSDGGSGVIINHGDCFDFVNFHAGFAYLTGIPEDSTGADLNEKLKGLPARRLHGCYSGRIKGPKIFKSWMTK